MTTLGALLADPPLEVEVPELSVVTSDREFAGASPDWVRDEQLAGLVTQLFLRPSSPVRHVGIAALEANVDTSILCLDVARTLTESVGHDVGLIDARLQSPSLAASLGADSDPEAPASMEIASRLWLVPRSLWIGSGAAHRVWDPSLSRLRETAMQFDFSILALDPVSWLTARMSQVCDGLVLVVTANKTRRLAAGKVRERLKNARVPLLGVVLADRRFPIPEALYRNL